MAFDRNEVQAYITEAARRRGIDPATALRVIKQESGFNPEATNLSPKEKSYGLMQLNTQGGLGVHALEKGINIRDPNTWRQQVDFGLDVVAKDGWRQWYGARDTGVGRWDGIGGRPAAWAGKSSGGAPLVDAVASRGGGQRTVAGDAGNDRLEPQVVGGSSIAPTVNIAIPPEQKSRAELLNAVVKRGMDMGSNARNGWDVLGGLAQVWAGSSEQKKLEGTENAALTGALAGLDPEYQMAAQLLGGREGAAQAILSQQEARTSAANRAEQRADRLAERDYQRSQDELDNARADRSLELQTAKANAAPDQPSSVREYEYAKSQGYTGSYQEWEQANRKAGATVVNTGQDEGEFQKKAAGRMVERFGGIADGQTGAANTVQTIPVMRELLTQAPTGPLAGRLAERFPGFSTAGDAFQATVNQIAPTLRIPGSGAMSDRDMDILMGSFPRLSSDPAANGLIMDVFEKKAQINLQRADIANRALRGEIDPGEADRQLSEIDRTPLFDDAMRARLTGQHPVQQSGSLVPGQDGGGQRYEGGVPVGGQGAPAPVRRATNRQTGEVLELRNGQWVPVR